MESSRFEQAVFAFDLALQIDADLHRAQIGLTTALDLCDRDMTRREPPTLRTTPASILPVLENLAEQLERGARSPFVNVHAIRMHKEMERRLAVNPNDADALFLKGAFLAEQGRFEDAVACVDRLTLRDEEYPGAVLFRKHLKELMLQTPHPVRRRRGACVPRS